MELTPEQIKELQALKKKLDDGYVLTLRSNLEQLAEDRRNMLAVFTALQPLLAPFAGNGEVNLMDAMPKLMQALPQLKQQLAEPLQKIAHLLA